jgi:hypothetical protein
MISTMAQKTYFLMPNFECKPDNYLKLGQIIKSYDRPLERLSEPLESLPKRETQVFRGWASSRFQSRLISGGIFTLFLAQILGFGADLDVTTSKQAASCFEADELEAQYFEPDNEYLALIADRKEIQQYLRRNPFTSIYIVTGLKIARGARYSSTIMTSVKGEAKVGFDASVFTGVPMQAGPKTAITRPKGEEISFENAPEFIYAYRLHRIIVSWRPKRVKARGYFRGANILSYGSEGDEDIDDTDSEVGVDGITLDDSDYGSAKHIPEDCQRRHVTYEDGVELQALIAKAIR